MKKILIVVLLCFASMTKAQEKMEYFPDDLTIQPFTANFLEPKLGFLFQLGEDDLRLDIGNSIDIFRNEIDKDGVFSFGADLFTYTKLRREENFHFPVDAVDYLFGLNFGYKKSIDAKREWGARFRISHISAHLVDGKYDKKNMSWTDNQLPRVYSREFFELIPYYKYNDLRLYVGITYIYHIDPAELGKDVYQFGFDYFYKDFSENIKPFAAYDLRIVNIDEYNTNHSLSLGLKFGKPEGKGFSIYLNYYNGKSIHGEYYEFDRDYTALGINLDL